MAVGAGKYDDLATLVREKANATGVVVVVLGGDQGNGFSVQIEEGAIDVEGLARLLEHMAKQMRADVQ